MMMDGEVYIDGEALEEPYLKEDAYGTYGPYVIPDGHYFMMGDNRNLSADSRYWSDPFIPEDDIKGKAFLRYWPLDRIGLLALEEGTYE